MSQSPPLINGSNNRTYLNEVTHVTCLAHSKLSVSVGGRAWASVGEHVSAGAHCPPGGQTVTRWLSVSAQVAQRGELEAKENVTRGTRATEEGVHQPGAGAG